ncbi:MAG: hypothetical protein EOP86_06155, partial [Verrucomicrobiaceae bacterium]
MRPRLFFANTVHQRFFPIRGCLAPILAVLLFCVSALKAEQAGDFTYTVDGAAVTVTGYTGMSELVVIPGKIANLPVTAIAGIGESENAAGIKGVIIPDSVTTIWDYTFAGCLSLRSVTIPSGVTRIEELAFLGCSALESIEIPAGITLIGYGVFDGCAGLTNLVIPPGVTQIGEFAFRGCTGLTHVTIPGHVTRIQGEAFQDCTGLTHVTILPGVTSIGEYAFLRCAKLADITIPEGVVSIGEGAFRNCVSLTEMVLPKGVGFMGMSAFEGCSGLQRITIPGSVANIGTMAFFKCGSLSEVALSEGVKLIGEYAFQDCASLTGMVIPQSVISIGSSAFMNCTGLTSLPLPDGLTSLGSGAFWGCAGLTSMVIPAGITTIGANLFYGCGALRTVSIPPDVTEIQTGAFEGCGSLTGITLPPRLTWIQPDTFRGCASLTSVALPPGLLYIQNGAFAECSELRNLVFPGNAPGLYYQPFTMPSRDFTVIAFPDSTGFTFPVWRGVKSARLRDSDTPFALLQGNAILSQGDTHDFGPKLTAGTISHVFSLVNTSGVPQSFAVSLSGSSSGAFSLGTSSLPAVIPSKSGGVFTVHFRPQGTGVLTAGLDITASGAVPASRHFTLVATGVTPHELAQSTYLKAPIPGQGDAFGRSIAISGDTMAVGVPHGDSPATGEGGGSADSGEVCVFVKSGTGWNLQARLQAPNPKAGDLFGSSVAIDGGNILVGAPGEDSDRMGINGYGNGGELPDSGAAWLFIQDGTDWRRTSHFKASRPKEGAGFGHAVALSGNTIAVGAWREGSAATGVNGDQSGTGATGSGAVYIFEYGPTFQAPVGVSVWSQTAFLKASNTGVNDGFGGAVGIYGSTVVVGAAGESSGATGIDGDQAGNDRPDAGAAYVFKKVRTDEYQGWRQQAYVKPSITKAGGRFGHSVGISGDTVIVGAPGEDSGGGADANSGAAYIFNRTGWVWNQQGRIIPPATVSVRHFGWSAAVWEDIAVVGSGEEGGNGDAPAYDGSACVLQRTDTAWIQQTWLRASNAGAGDLFGASAAVSGNTIAIGAPGEDSASSGADANQSDNSASGAGAAYLFEIGLRPAAPVFTLQPPDSQAFPAGASPMLIVGVSGVPAPLLQWYRGVSGDTSSPVEGARWKTFISPPLNAGASFWVRATNAAGSADSGTFSLSIIPAHTAVEQWRILHFGNPDNSGAAADNGDPDGDGVINLDEFIAGTVPTDRSDAFRIISSGFTNGGFRVIVPGKKNRSYQLFRNGNMESPSWEPVAARRPADADGPVELTDPSPSS